MKRVLLTAAAAGVTFLVFALGAASAPQDELTPPTLLAPANGEALPAGRQIVFRIASHAGDRYLWLHVSRSAAPAAACGTIGHDAEIESFAATADPTIYEARPALFSHSTFWMNTPGTYYWQAFRIHYGSGADGCIESEVRSFTIVAAGTPTQPKPTPPQPAQPAPKAPGALPNARLAGVFAVTTKVTSASGLGNVKRGSVDAGDWRFTPLCSKGACNVLLRFTHGLVGSRTATMRLTRRGSAYAGGGTVKLTTCMFKPVPGTMSVRLSVTRGAWVDGVWRATRISGSYRYAAREFTTGTFRCKASALTAVVRGSADVET